MRAGFWALLCLFLFGACRKPTEGQSPGTKALPKITLQMDWYAQAEQGGYYQALVKGFYRAAGLDVTIRETGPGVAPGQIISSSTRGFFAIGRGDEAIVQVARDIPIVVVASQMQHDPTALLIHSESSVHTFRDLEGKAVMTTPGANWIGYVQSRFHVRFAIIPLNFGIAQFMADPSFIQQCFVTNEPYYVEQRGVHVRTLLLSDSGFDPYRVLVGNADFVAKNPEITRAFVQASIQGWNDYLHGDPSPAFHEIASRNIQMTPDFLAYSYKAMKRNRLVEGDPTKGEGIGRLSRRRLQDQINALEELGVLDRPITVDEVADLQFTHSQ